MRHVLIVWFAISAILTGSTAWAATCTASNGTVNLGALSSFAVASLSTATQGSTGFICTGSPSSQSSVNTIDATLNTNSNALGTTPRLFNTEAGAYLPYAICADASCGTIYSLGSIVKWNASTVTDLLKLFAATGGALPLYVRPEAGVQLPKGIYTDTINVSWSWSVCSQEILGLCHNETRSDAKAINVTLEVLNDCFIDSAPDLSFGSAALISAFTPVTQNVQVRCTPQATYRVGFDMGNNPSGGWRRMLSGSNALQYNIYIPDTSTVWNTTTTVVGAGTGATQQISYRAVINPAQNNVPAGTYTDTVRMILSY